MQDKIKLKRLRKIAEELTERAVHIIFTTMFNDNDQRKAMVTFNTNTVDIVINGNKIKSAEDVIDAVAHELAHVYTNSDEHSKEFMRKWNELYSIIKEKYLFIGG